MNPFNVGNKVFVPAALFPNEACRELQGRAWEVIVMSSSPKTVLVKFVHARAPDGREFEPIHLPRERLCVIPP